MGGETTLTIQRRFCSFQSTITNADYTQSETEEVL